MWVRWTGLSLALALVGGAAGFGLGVVSRTSPTSLAVAEPVPAASPSIPVEAAPPYDDDIDYQPLGRGLGYRADRLGDPPFTWRYDVPRGWRAEEIGFVEVRWRPADEPLTGGFSLRVKIVNEHKTDAEMVAQKRAAVLRIYDDVEILGETDDILSFRYREPETNRLRFNSFRWFTPAGGSTTEFEMSVVGRQADVDGLDDLFDHVAASVRRVA